jgi:hypothetical protein
MGKAEERFELKPEAIKDVVIPQCGECIKNISRLDCTQFTKQTKPLKYLRNYEECPYKKVNKE